MVKKKKKEGKRKGRKKGKRGRKSPPPKGWVGTFHFSSLGGGGREGGEIGEKMR